MKQYVIEKQNKHSFTIFTTRVLTVDARAGFLFVSGKDKEEDASYHKVKISTLQFWPDFSSAYVFESMKSTAAQCTVLVKGVEMKSTPEDAARIAAQTLPKRQTSLNPFAASEESPPLPHTISQMSGGSQLSDSTSDSPGKGKSIKWILRFTNLNDVDDCKQFLTQHLPEAKVTGKEVFSYTDISPLSLEGAAVPGDEGTAVAAPNSVKTCSKPKKERVSLPA